jgi:hypothetical protein
MASGWRRTVPALVLLALTARGLAAAGLAVIPRDGTVYVELSRAVSEAGPAAAFAGRQHPLYPLAVGLLGGSEVAAVLLSVAAGALAAPAVLLIGTRLHSRALGVLAALLYAVAPVVVRNTSAPLLEGLSIPLFLWALERGLASSERPRNAVWAGLLGGASYLARPEALELLVVLPLGLVALRRFRAAALLALCFLAVGGPYAAWLTKEAGSFTVSRKKPAARFVSAEAGFDEHMERKARRTGISRPTFGASVVETARTLGEAGSWVLLLLAVAGLHPIFRHRPRGPALLLLALLALDLFLRFRLLHLHGYLAKRHLVLATCMLLPFSAAGLAFLARRRTAHAAGLLGATLLVLSILPRDREKLPLKEAGRWIRAQGGTAPVVATFGSPRIAYYAGGKNLEVLPSLPDPGAGVSVIREILIRAQGEADWLAIVTRRWPWPDTAAPFVLERGPDYRSRGALTGWRVSVWKLR